AYVDVYGVKVASAETSAEVLQDLRKDKDFNENDYPYVSDDYSLQVIQIAESSNKELFVYAYQPCHDTYDLVGTKISISYGYSLNGAGLTPKLYNLRLVSTSGTLDKYYVDGFTVPNDGDRYYNIVEIFRMVHSDIDESDEEFPKTDIAYSVGQQWYVCDLNGSKHYEMNTFNTLYVDTVFNGNFTFEDGLTWSDLIKTDKPTDCWFYCFSVEEYVIKHIYDADLNYSIRDVRDTYGYGDHTLTYSNERVNQVITLKDSDVMSYSGPGLGAKDFKWNRILSSEKFIETALKQGVKISDIQREKIKESQWVFTYLETDRTEDKYGSSMTGGVHHIDNYSDVYDVGLLRLHFQDISGNYYDLGVVNDLTDPDNIADGVGAADLAQAFKDFWDMFVKIILTIIFLIFLVLVLQFVPGVKRFFKFIRNAIKTVISAPFKLLKSIFKKGG
ncbi:MAG: hypothetical protein K2L12_02735, partial [Clostridia bacterium]|nr:hypothetical protein [Clostridia bacterium]